MVTECAGGERCAKCGGGCCKSMGCHFSPHDFDDLSIESLTKIISEGDVSIDWWEGDVTGGDLDETYFLRMRHVGAKIVDPSWGGRCVALTNSGCRIPFEKRPLGGRALIPSENQKDCKQTYSKENCCRDWYPYQDILAELRLRFCRIAA